MIKCKVSLFFVSILVLLFTLAGNATVIEYDAGTYTSDDNLYTIYERTSVDLAHSSYYILGLSDFEEGRNLDVINIVFHDIYNWKIEDNWLNVYIFDEPTKLGWTWGGYDGDSLADPDWEATYNATSLGTWSYVSETKDVVFTTSDSALLAYLQGGESFGIGIDPDCHFYGSSISVETSAPVPEPTTLLLLGSGLIAIAGFRKRK